MIENIIITSFFVLGYCCTFWDGMILEKAGEWLESVLPEYVTKPLFACFICSTFWLGTALYWSIWGESLKEWIVTVVAAMGLNAVLSKLFRYD